jgi:hypothetical protein
MKAVESASLCSRRVCTRQPTFRDRPCVFVDGALGRHTIRPALACAHLLYHLVLLAHVPRLDLVRTLAEHARRDGRWCAASVRAGGRGRRDVRMCGGMRARRREAGNGPARSASARRARLTIAGDSWRRMGARARAAARATWTVGARTPAIPPRLPGEWRNVVLLSRAPIPPSTLSKAWGHTARALQAVAIPEKASRPRSCALARGTGPARAQDASCCARGAPMGPTQPRHRAWAAPGEHDEWARVEQAATSGQVECGPLLPMRTSSERASARHLVDHVASRTHGPSVNAGRARATAGDFYAERGRCADQRVDPPRTVMLHAVAPPTRAHAVKSRRR